MATPRAPAPRGSRATPRVSCDELATELRAHPTFGSELKIFFDDQNEPGEGLDPNSGLTGQLRTAIGDSAILTVLMSDHYLRSKWCADERDFWIKSSRTDRHAAQRPPGAGAHLGHHRKLAAMCSRTSAAIHSWAPASTIRRKSPLPPGPLDGPHPTPRARIRFASRLLSHREPHLATDRTSQGPCERATAGAGGRRASRRRVRPGDLSTRPREQTVTPGTRPGKH